MEKSEFFFEQIIKFRGYTLRIYGEDFLRVVITKGTCPILSFEFSTNVANPNNPKFESWIRSKLVCTNRQGNLCLDLRGKVIEKNILRLPWDIINSITDGVTECFSSVPGGLLNHFIISSGDDHDFACNYETTIYPTSGTCLGSGGIGNSKIVDWIRYFNSGERCSFDKESDVVMEVISFCKSTVSSIIIEHEKRVNKKVARDNYVRSENDKKVFLYSDCRFFIAITEDGISMGWGVKTFYGNTSGDFYEDNIKSMKENFAENHWELCPIVATAADGKAMEILDLFIQKASYSESDSLVKLRRYLMGLKSSNWDHFNDLVQKNPLQRLPGFPFAEKFPTEYIGKKYQIILVSGVIMEAKVDDSRQFMSEGLEWKTADGNKSQSVVAAWKLL